MDKQNSRIWYPFTSDYFDKSEQRNRERPFPFDSDYFKQTPNRNIQNQSSTEKKYQHSVEFPVNNFPSLNYVQEYPTFQEKINYEQNSSDKIFQNQNPKENPDNDFAFLEGINECSIIKQDENCINTVYTADKAIPNNFWEIKNDQLNNKPFATKIRKFDLFSKVKTENKADIDQIENHPIFIDPQQIEIERREVIEKHRILRPDQHSQYNPVLQYNYNTGENWYYTLTDDFRVYQFEITRKCLIYNTLVCLPTGLGKTLIAANVILNYYKWFLEGQIFFLAPTRALANQQSQCLNAFKDIDKFDIVNLDGMTCSTKRRDYYKTKKIFFMTPQTMNNDISKGSIDLRRITLMVLDEAHRATDGYAYSRLIRDISLASGAFRILGLTATPANNQNDIQAILTNLKIRNVEILEISDKEIVPYIQNKNINTIVIEQNDEGNKIDGSLRGIIKWTWDFLARKLDGPCERLIFESKKDYFTFYDYDRLNNSYLKNSNFYRKTKGANEIFEVYAILGMFMRWINLRKCLMNQSFESFKDNFENIWEKFPIESGSLYHSQLIQTPMYCRIMTAANVLTEEQMDRHPKVIELTKIITKFIDTNYQNSLNSRCIIFSGTRCNVFFINKRISVIPGVKSSIFVGKSTGDKNRASRQSFSNKEQVNTMNEFKKGNLNVLVATSIAEEGIDIGEIDLIICYDDGLDPIRLLQRMGRTGRVRNGEIYMLLTETEEKKYNISRKKYETTIKALRESNPSLEGRPNSCFRFYDKNPRMIGDLVKQLDLKPVETLCNIEERYAVSDYSLAEDESISDQNEEFINEDKTKTEPAKKEKRRSSYNPAIKSDDKSKVQRKPSVKKSSKVNNDYEGIQAKPSKTKIKPTRQTMLNFVSK